MVRPGGKENLLPGVDNGAHSGVADDHNSVGDLHDGALGHQVRHVAAQGDVRAPGGLNRHGHSAGV